MSGLEIRYLGGVHGVHENLLSSDGKIWQIEVDPLVAAFKNDLERPRPPEERNAVYDFALEYVTGEQARLLSTSRTALSLDGNHRYFHKEDVILGDAPLIGDGEKLDGEYVLLPTEIAAKAFFQRFYNLWILNHPARIRSLKEYIVSGFQENQFREVPVLEDAINGNKAIDFDDLGLFVRGPVPGANVEDSARTLLAKGPYTWVADNLAALPYIQSSMPDVSNSMSIATHALSGGLAFVPFDSIWNSHEVQMQVANKAWEIVQNDPVIANHPDRDFLLEHRKRLIGITLKPNLKSIEDMKHFVRQGFTTFRIYDARSRGEMEGVFKLMIDSLQNEEFNEVRNKITFLVGQLSDPDQGLRIQEMAQKGNGVGLGVVVGIGGGGICETPTEAGILTANVNLGYSILKAGFKKPVLFDGGVGDKLPVLLAMGGRAAFKSQALNGGCIEQPPGLWYLTREGKIFYKEYNGEAAPETKKRSGKTDFLERVLFPEGVGEKVLLNSNALSQTENVFSLVQSISTALIFQRVENFEDLARDPGVRIGTATETAKLRASVHHRS